MEISGDFRRTPRWRGKRPTVVPRCVSQSPRRPPVSLVCRWPQACGLNGSSPVRLVYSAGAVDRLYPLPLPFRRRNLQGEGRQRTHAHPRLVSTVCRQPWGPENKGLEGGTTCVPFLGQRRKGCVSGRTQSPGLRLYQGCSVAHRGGALRRAPTAALPTRTAPSTTRVDDAIPFPTLDPTPVPCLTAAFAVYRPPRCPSRYILFPPLPRAHHAF